MSRSVLILINTEENMLKMVALVLVEEEVVVENSTLVHQEVLMVTGIFSTLTCKTQMISSETSSVEKIHLLHSLMTRMTFLEAVLDPAI